MIKKALVYRATNWSLVITLAYDIYINLIIV